MLNTKLKQYKKERICMQHYFYQKQQFKAMNDIYKKANKEYRLFLKAAKGLPSSH